MTQPPLSRQIQNLEHAIQVQLLQRDSRRVTLTPAGEAFLKESRKLLSLANSAPDLAKRIADGAVGTVRIGFTAAAAYTVLGGLLTGLNAALPDVSVDLVELVTSEQIEALLNGDIDLGIGRPPFDLKTFEALPIHTEPLVVAMHATHRLADTDRPLEASDFVNENFIMHSPIKARYFYDMTAGLLSTTHIRAVHTVSQILTMVCLVSAGRGLAIVPESARALGIHNVHFSPLHSASPRPVELHAVWLRDSENPALANVRTHLHRHFTLTAD